MAVFLVFAILVIGNCATEDHTGNNRTAFVSRVCFIHLKRRRYRQGNRQGQKRFDEKVGYPHASIAHLHDVNHRIMNRV